MRDVTAFIHRSRARVEEERDKAGDFLTEMDRVISWLRLINQIKPYYPTSLLQKLPDFQLFNALGAADQPVVAGLKQYPE
jgi:hypothetical protein